MKSWTLGLCLTVGGAVLGAIIGKSAIYSAIGTAIGYIAGALIDNPASGHGAESHIFIKFL